MPPEELPNATASSKPFDAELRKDLRKSLALALPTLLIGMSVGWLKDRIGNQPGQALWIVIPGIILLSLIFLRATTRQKLRLGWPFLVFLPIYILIFSIAAQSSLLDWKGSLVGYEKIAPPNFLALNRLGDWHYWFATEEPADKDLVIVWLKRSETVEEGRLQIADLIQLAQDNGAKGVALDHYFENGTEDKDVDNLLCEAVDSAGKRNDPLPVFVAYDYKLKDGRLDQLPIDPDLKRCFPETTQAHLVGYAEWDGMVRSVPLFFRGNRESESLSLKIARKLDSQVKAPDNGLLQFIKPEQDFPALTYEELEQGSDEDRAILRGRFILVGENSEQDSFRTPYGTQPGVVVHAYAIQSLRHNHFITRAPWWTSLLMIFLLCYFMMVLTSRGVRNLKVIAVNLAFSVFIVAIAIVAMYLWLTWIDLVYPLLATWVFLIALLVMRAVRKKNPQTDPYPFRVRGMAMD
jgi:CHASE2 domain-containing sensor protein